MFNIQVAQNEMEEDEDRRMRDDEARMARASHSRRVIQVVAQICKPSHSANFIEAVSHIPVESYKLWLKIIGMNKTPDFSQLYLIIRNQIMSSFNPVST
ncbi:hypothetical protein ACFX16_022608 [Malus domestica]